ncbi:MAG: sigma-70 family RNA polymerase sigma factor [Lachnospiraceae bacterium]|nr:sigma-70 family RNA polymerase sigma factor [Lachnospiraceae bacterium]
MSSDEQLIRKIRRNHSRDAADELLCRYYKEIYAYTYRQSGDKELAMDLTQDIFITILQGINSFDERKAKFRTWAYHIASNKITDYYRSRAHKIAQSETMLLPLDLESCSEPLEDTLLEFISNRETIRHVMEIVIGFDADWIEIFRRKCFLEQTFRQIADQMNLSENTVKTRYYNIIRKIKKEVLPNED